MKLQDMTFEAAKDLLSKLDNRKYLQTCKFCTWSCSFKQAQEFLGRLPYSEDYWGVYCMDQSKFVDKDDEECTAYRLFKILLNKLEEEKE